MANWAKKAAKSVSLDALSHFLDLCKAKGSIKIIFTDPSFFIFILIKKARFILIDA